MEYEIVKYNQEFKSQIVQLQTHLWSPDVSLNTAYFEWKHERNPYVDTPLIYVVLRSGKVVGMRGMFGAKWQIGSPGQTFLVPCASDLVIAPDHRDRGLYTKIMKAAFADLSDLGYRYVFNLSANPVNFLGSLTMGWRTIGDLQTMHRRAYHKTIPHRLRSYLTRMSFTSSTKKQDPFHSLDENSTKRRGKISHYVSVEQTPRPKAMAELVKRIVNDGRIRQSRDPDYFEWRFNNPLSSYRFLFWEESRLEGYLILQTRLNDDTSTVKLADWEAANLQVRTDLLQAALLLGNFDNLKIWTATFPDEVTALLKENKFRLLKKAKSIAEHRTSVLVRPVQDGMLNADWTIDDRRLLDLSNWDLRMIYSDGS
jgi:hypothetical protein